MSPPDACFLERMIRMSCRNCPYGKADFERKMQHYQKIVQEQGIPNNLYLYLEPKDAADEFEKSIWCDKVDGKVCVVGCCEDANKKGEH